MFPKHFRFAPVLFTFSLLIVIYLVKDTKEEVRNMILKKLETYRIKNILKTVSCSTELQCCAQCLEEDGCVSINIRKNSTSLNCDLNWMSPLEATVSIEKSANWTVFYVDNDPWKLVFRLTAGGGTDPYQAWKNGVGTDNSDDCMMLYPPWCTSYYRHELLDEWKNWSVEQVKFALYDNHTQAAYIIFNGTGSDMESWFSMERVLESSWKDIMEASQLLYFSIAGDSIRGRQFFIHEYYGGCPGDRGWTATTVSGIHRRCSFDNHPSYPGIVYARNGTKSIYYSTDTPKVLNPFAKTIDECLSAITKTRYGIADVLAVYIKLK